MLADTNRDAAFRALVHAEITELRALAREKNNIRHSFIDRICKISTADKPDEIEALCGEIDNLTSALRRNAKELRLNEERFR